MSDCLACDCSIILSSDQQKVAGIHYDVCVTHSQNHRLINMHKVCKVTEILSISWPLGLQWTAYKTWRCVNEIHHFNATQWKIRHLYLQYCTVTPSAEMVQVIVSDKLGQLGFHSQYGCGVSSSVPSPDRCSGSIQSPLQWTLDLVLKSLKL